MSKSKQMRGSSRRVAGPKNSTLSWSPDETSQRLGFRLATDDTISRVLRGSSYGSGKGRVKTAERECYGPQAWGAGTGFRLVREDA